MAGIAFSGCIGNSGNDQNATVEETSPASSISGSMTDKEKDEQVIIYECASIIQIIGK